MDICLSAARAAASRRNGAKSRGPKTPEGKARSAQNALKHGFRAQAHIVLPREDAAGFAALEAALAVELAPESALQSVLVHRIACATWRLHPADRFEVEVFAHRSYGNAGLGLTLIRDGNGTRSIETLMRYRGAAMAELMRALRALKALQAEAARLQGMREAEPDHMREAAPALPAPTQEEMPIEPEARGDPGETACAPPAAGTHDLGAEPDQQDAHDRPDDCDDRDHGAPQDAHDADRAKKPNEPGKPSQFNTLGLSEGAPRPDCASLRGQAFEARLRPSGSARQRPAEEVVHE